MLYSVSDFKDIIKRLEEHNEEQEKIIDRLHERVRTFNEQDSLQELRSQVNYAYKHSLLPLTDKELQSMNIFVDKHYNGKSEDITDESKF